MWIRPKGVLLANSGWSMVTDHVVQIEDGIIRAVVPDRPLNRSRLLELPQDYLVPGLIDLHVHLHPGILAPSHGPSLPAVQSHAETLLGAGITTVRDVGSPSELLTMRETLNNPARFPRILMAGRPITVPQGHASSMGYLVQDKTDILRVVRSLYQEGVDLIKVMATAGGSEGCQPHFSQQELSTLVEQAHAYGLRVAAHAHSSEGIRRCVYAGVDTIEHASFKEGSQLVFDEGVADLMAQASCTAVFTPVNYRKAEAAHDALRMHEIENQWHALYARGVSVAIGTDVGVPVMPFIDSTVYAAEVLERAGIPPRDVLHIMWDHGARCLGLESEIGIIRAGARADLIGVQENPLTAIRALRNIHWIMRDGVIVKGV